MTQEEFEKISPEASIVARKSAMSVSGNSADAMDIAQDVMLKLWTMHSQIAGSGEMLRLSRIMGRRIAIDFWRSNNRKKVQFDAADYGLSVQSPAEDLEAEEAEQWLIKCMEKLPSAEYQILRMRQVEGKSNSEIARILQIAPHSVANMLSRARHKMLQEMEKASLIDKS